MESSYSTDYFGGDVRPFVVPEFDKVTNNISQGLVRQGRQHATNELFKEAKVSKGNY